ncbi:MAG: CHASE2 domain-containing protein [Comamonas sp.]|nr:CHASE2 domain-containing protein [Candidatus Comamonas equi]
MHFPIRPPWPRAFTLSLTTEWLLMSAMLLALVARLAGPGQLSRLNGWMQDVAARVQMQPASPAVVLIVADEASIAAIGRWPWRRALHAKLIQQVSAGAPQSIGMDILFTEPDLDYPEDDALLAQAIAASGRVVLPVMPDLYRSTTHSTVLPLPELVGAAARLAHVQLSRDGDGSIRSFYALEGPPQAPWLHLGLAMRCLEQPAPALCQSSAAKPTTSTDSPAPWQRQLPMHMALAGGQPPFTTYSYLDVLRGRIPPSAFRNKHVVVGVMATGLSTPNATPGSGAQHASYNVELVGHILNGDLQDRHTTLASAWASRTFNAVPVLLALLALALCGPSVALLIGVGLALLAVMTSWAAALWWQLALSPAAALLGIALAYPLWSWRRLNAAARFLNQSMQDLQSQGLPMLAPRTLPMGDLLQHRIQAVVQASEQLRQLHQFVTETLLQLPSATLACDSAGRIVLANSAAHRYAAALGRSLQPHQPVADLLEGSMERGSLKPLWDAQALPSLTEPLQREGMDVLKNSLLLLCQPFTVGAQTGWLISLVDISALRQALAQRDDAMHFISHDIRSPNSAILTVIEMEQHFGQQAASPQLIERIQRYARSSLALADDFIHLARAQHTPVRQLPVELGQVIDHALDDTWAAAQAHQVQLDWLPQETEAWVRGDANMLRRACVNLLSNAIKYGPSPGTVWCTLTRQEDDWVIAVRDAGDGIGPEEQARLFAPFQRQAQHEASSIAGTGLGLAYVHTVAQQHGGSIRVHSAVGQGATFLLHLPAAPAPQADTPE